jgi:RHS repeat-associated protein
MKIRVLISILGLTLALFLQLPAHGAVGRTPGKFAVSSTGSAQYTIPLWSPPGPHGMQPNLALFYDSRSGIGPLGVGWTIKGLGQIVRCNKTVAQDGAAAPVALVAGDGYCINGNRLRLTSGTYGTAGSVYQTEIADFSQITADGTAGAGPAYFVVQARNGLTYYYGYTDSNGNGANSQVLASGTSTAMMWLLSKVIDRSGNNYVINYTTFSDVLIGTAVPTTILWTPSGAGSSTYLYSMQFNYSSNVAQSSVAKYVGGTVVSNTKLLSSIEVLYNSTVVKDYFLTYTASTTTGRKQLTSVQECPNTTQSNSNCLAATTVTYGNPTAGVSTTAQTALSATGAYLTTRYDLNGDGYPDLVYEAANGSAWYVAFGSATGYGAPVNIGINTNVNGNVLIGRMNGTHQDGVLANNDGTWYYYSWNGSDFTATSTGLAYDSTATGYQLADVNGDGLADLVSYYVTYSKQSGESTATIDVRLNSTNGSTESFSSTNATWYTSGTVEAAVLFTPDMQYGKLRRFDFNGDGRDDLVLTTTLNGVGWNNYELISTGSSFTATEIQATVQYAFFTNWNDDACTDYVANGTLYVSGCNGTIPQTYSIGANVVAAMDWDGDGRTDLVVQNGSALGVYLSTGSGVSSLVTTSLPNYSNCVYVTMDTTGGGIDDLGCWIQSGSTEVTYYPHNGVPDLVTEFDDGFGNSASPTYIPITNGYYARWFTATYPYATYIGPLYVVDKATFSDASHAGETWYQQFWYAEAWLNLQGRGFAGFSNKQTYDSRSGLWETQARNLTFPYTGTIVEDLLTQNSNNTAPVAITSGTVQSITLSSATNEERYFTYLSPVTKQRYEVGGAENGDLITTGSTTYSFDDYGNALTTANTVTDNDPNSPYTGESWTTTTVNTTDISQNQTQDLAAWCLNLIDETQVTYTSSVSGSGSVTRTKTFTPDTASACRIKTAVTEPTANSGLYKVTEAQTFDSFGNVATDTITGANMPSSPASRETQLNWGTTGQFLNTSTDPSGAVTTRSYTSAQALTFGVPDSQKDANNLTTSWTYDAFGRKTEETRPDGTSTGWAWSLCTSYCGWSNSVYQIAQTAYQTNGTTAIRTDTTSYDPVDRVTQTSGPTVAGTAAIVQKLYNSLGLLTQQSMPFLSGATAYQQTYSYDLINRPSTVTRPISSSNSSPQTTSYAYAGRKLTVTDPNGNAKTNLTDVNGWLRQSVDAYGYNVVRTYDTAGTLIDLTDSVGNALLKNVTVVYGIKPFITASTDADRGAWTYTIDSLGERTGWTDAKGQSFSMTYDALSRPLTRTEPDLFTEWNYGAAAPNWGRMTSECTASASTTNLCTTTGSSWLYKDVLAYDSLARPSTSSITESGNTGGNDGGGAFLYTLAYSSTSGLLNTVTYPTSTSSFALTLQYGYGYGLLQSVTDTSDTTATCGTTCVLWTANAENGFGEVTKKTLGNGVVTNRTYDAVTSWLTAATAGVGGGSAVLNQSYLEDKNGNITQRQDNNLGLTESLFYDNDYRLTCATLSSSCSTPTFAYDGGSSGPGNITTQTGVGTYTYPAAGQPRPHAVTSITGTFNGITNPAFSYDANGNMTARASSTANISWYSSNYPETISASDPAGSEEVQFNYGPDRQRWEQVYTGPSGTEQTYYVGKRLEVVFNGTTNYRHYIYAGSEPVAIYNRSSAGMNTMSYFLEDHQGGVSAITSNAGATDVTQSYSAFGQMRDSQTWSGAPTAAQTNSLATLTRQGYTFQTGLGQSMGLNHMNGRVQDAILGRFLSPDPKIPDPSSSQSYNRYSYTGNNPLTLIDPSGFDANDPYYSQNGDNFDPNSGAGAFEETNGDCEQCTVNQMQTANQLTALTAAATQLANQLTNQIISTSIASAIAGGSSSQPSSDTGLSGTGPDSGSSGGGQPGMAQSPSSQNLMPYDPNGGCYSLCIDPNGNSGASFQVGINGSAGVLAGSATATVGIAIDSSGNIAFYGEYGGGLSTSPDASLNLTGSISNARTLDDLNGPFTNYSAGAGWGEHTASTTFVGSGAQGQPILGTGFAVGVGAGGASSVTGTTTTVSTSVNIWNAFASWICGWALCGP